MTESDFTVKDLRSFVPAQDFNVSRSFYKALGWRETWSDDHLAVMEIQKHRFYLQNYYVKDWAENTMLHISVEDAGAWRERMDQLIEQRAFADVRVDGPKQETYGALVTYAWDPCGVLLHFAQWYD